MRIGIVLYEDESWILAKFARNMQNDLVEMGIKAEILKHPGDGFDINHHIDFSYCINQDIQQVNCIHTSMITHTDDIQWFRHAKAHVEVIDLGICMSKDQVTKLTGYGVPGSKLTYINPAHDALTRMRPTILGLSSRIYMDGRKNESILPRALKQFDNSLFYLKIMGPGWETVVEKIKSLGFAVDYRADFNRDEYRKMISSLDYYMYFGEDEGSMGYLDALYAGVGTIVTPQGFHLDVACKIDFPIQPTVDSLSSALQKISADRIHRRDSVKSWTWHSYSRKHVHIWQTLLRGEKSTISMPGLEETAQKIDQPRLTGRYFLRGWRRMKHRATNQGVGSLFSKIIEKLLPSFR